MAAADLGVEVLQVACGPLSNGSSLPNAQRVVANLREFGHTVNIDDRALAHVADYFARLTEAENLPAGAPQEYDASFLRHQVAGGVLTTTRRQLAELSSNIDLPNCMREVVQVRAELGYPIMVTPFPQIVCTQALYNIIGSERYGNVSDQVIRYVLGKFGRPTVPVDANVKDEFSVDHAPKNWLPNRRPCLRKNCASILRSEFLTTSSCCALRCPPKKSMRCLPLVRRGSTTIRTCSQIFKLLRGLQSRPAASDVVIEKRGLPAWSCVVRRIARPARA